MPIDGVGTFIGEAEDDDAWLVEDAEGEDLAEVQIERQNNAGVGAGALNELRVGGALQSQRPDVNCLVTKLLQELDRLGRDASIR